MLIYKDIVSDDEFGSDALEPKIVDGVLYEIDCKMVLDKAVEVNTGANASAEEAEEALEDGARLVNNVVQSHSLQKVEMEIKKKDYMTHLKKYFKAIKDHLSAPIIAEHPELVPGEKDSDEVKAEKKAKLDVLTKPITDPFEKKAAVAAKRIVGNWADYDVYLGESNNFDGMYALLNYREDGVTPYFTIWKDGLKEYKY